MELIDPVVIKEKTRKLSLMKARISDAEKAAKALLWFKEYLIEKNLAEVFKPSAGVVASATPGASEAQEFLTLAAQHLRGEIAAKAIELAQTRHDNVTKDLIE
jgi:hypothetical protein